VLRADCFRGFDKGRKGKRREMGNCVLRGDCVRGLDKLLDGKRREWGN